MNNNDKFYTAIKTLRSLNLPDDFYATSAYGASSIKTSTNKLVVPDDLPEDYSPNRPPWSHQVFCGYAHKQGKKIQHFWVETENRLLYIEHAERVAEALAPYGSVSFDSSWRWERTEELPSKYIPIYSVFCVLGEPGKVPPLYSLCKSPDPRADWRVNDWCKSKGVDIQGDWSWYYTETGFVVSGSKNTLAKIRDVYSDCTFTLEGKGEGKRLRVDFP